MRRGYLYTHLIDEDGTVTPVGSFPPAWGYVWGPWMIAGGIILFCVTIVLASIYHPSGKIPGPQAGWYTAGIFGGVPLAMVGGVFRGLYDFPYRIQRRRGGKKDWVEIEGAEPRE